MTLSKLIVASALAPLMITHAINLAAEEVNLDDVTMNVVSERVRDSRSIALPAREIILDYMLENGDLTQEELDAQIAERQALREELKALKESGDEEALTAKKDELKALRQQHREEIQGYLEENEELREQVEAVRAEHQEAREGFHERMRERHHQLREHQQGGGE
ncbi:hypothetical protein HBA55_03160 [Pseudomaricurvus alkylphenolicus]|uniref:hypothetical protein n=1 Tax=Pseudomaricurvus alkylphenolicus TaxID=1306991 RepID=UPI00142174FB|nr:hypothetical protein [Pseudomaricurvus alkylphenolicus]NIB38566.1 hypothetical protein [Pseudomaricurvus alkylphenolicus]